MKICFYKNMYDEDVLVWVAGKSYKVLEINNEQQFYYLESEIPNSFYGVEFKNKSTYYIID